MILATVLMIQAKGPWAEDVGVEGTRAGDSQVNEARIANSPVIGLGVYGETFPVEENNLLEVIRAKLQDLSGSGKLEEHQKTILNKAKEQLNRPYPVKGLSRTRTPRSFPYDPSIVVPYDLKVSREAVPRDAASRGKTPRGGDHQDQVFHRKGTRVNPLDTHRMNCPLLFVDGDDAEQVFWAIQQYKAAASLHKPKIILVQGAPFNLSKKLNLPVYFDQFGVLVKKLGITQVPARVSQKEKTLVIDEVDPKAGVDLTDPTGSK
jgi:conjugal transfer pilus assembly protein TraW